MRGGLPGVWGRIKGYRIYMIFNDRLTHYKLSIIG